MGLSAGGTLNIGTIAVDPPVVLAPMAGVTNTAFRRLCRSYGGGLYVSEMGAAPALVEGNRKTMRMVAPPQGGPPPPPPLYGVAPAPVARPVRIPRPATRLRPPALYFCRS